ARPNDAGAGPSRQQPAADGATARAAGEHRIAIGGRREYRRRRGAARKARGPPHAPRDAPPALRPPSPSPSLLVLALVLTARQHLRLLAWVADAWQDQSGDGESPRCRENAHE